MNASVPDPARPADDEPELLTLHIQVCRPCVDREPGTCHAPGCFFCRRSIDEVPTYLECYVDTDTKR